MADRGDTPFQSLTPPVREGTIPWTVQGFQKARAVVRKVRSGELKLPRGAGGIPPELLADTPLDQVALGLWLRRQYRDSDPEVLAAHHLRFHAVEAFLARHGDLLMEEGLVRREDDWLEPTSLLLAELVERPYDVPVTSAEPPEFDAGEVLKAVARRAR